MSNNACTWSYAFTIFSRCWHPFIFWVPSAFVSRSLLLGLGWSSTFSQDSCHLRASSISEPWIPDAGSEGWRVQHELCSEMIAYENLKHASHTLGRKVRSRAKHWEHKCLLRHFGERKSTGGPWYGQARLSTYVCANKLVTGPLSCLSRATLLFGPSEPCNLVR